MFIARALGPSIFVGSFCFSCTWSESWVGLLWNISTSALLACFRFNQLCAIWRENNTNESFVNIALFFTEMRHAIYVIASSRTFLVELRVVFVLVGKYWQITFLNHLYFYRLSDMIWQSKLFSKCFILTSDTYLPRIFCVKHTFYGTFLWYTCIVTSLCNLETRITND